MITISVPSVVIVPARVVRASFDDEAMFVVVVVSRPFDSLELCADSSWQLSTLFSIA
jgi:hypothetical protein